MKKTLFFFTSTFPCDPTLEHYIEHELPFLSKSFENVYIFPSNYQKIYFKIQSNVMVLNIYDKKYYKGGFCNMLSNIPLFVKTMTYEILNSNLDKSLFFLNFRNLFFRINNAIQSANSIRSIINDLGLKSKEIIFYSYWFNHSALTLSFSVSMGIIDKFYSRGHMGEIYKDISISEVLLSQTKLKSVKKLFLISKHAYRHILYLNPRFNNKFDVSYLASPDYGISKISKELVIVSCSKYAKRKNLELIAEVVSKINSNFKWFHIGKVPTKKKNVLKSISKNPSNINFLDHLPNSQVLEFYNNTRISFFINLSSIEGLPVSIIEALSFGIPIIATNIYGVTEIIEDTYGKLFFTTSSSDEISLYINNLTLDKLKKMSINAKRAHQKLFLPENNFKEFINKISD